MKQLLHLLLYIILSIQFVNGQIQDIDQIEIFTLSGESIRRFSGSDLLKIDVSRLEPGMYLLRLMGRDRIFSKLFVKN